MLADLLYRIRALLGRARAEAELERELEFHLERQAEKLVRSGMSPEEAARRARLALGGAERIREECRDARGTRWLLDWIQDWRYAVRALRKNPVFAATAAITIALGIGASAAMFSVTDSVLLRPLPYRNPDRLVLLEPMLSSAYFHDLREAAGAVFDEMSAIMVYRAVSPLDDGGAERISKGQVTTNFFRMLGAKIAVGRDFTEADGRPEADPEPVFPPPQGSVAILSHEYWQRRFGGDAAVIGRRMPGSGRPGPLIVGVLAPGFRLYLPARVTAEPSPDVWVANNRGYDAAHRGQLMLRVIGVRKAGVTPERARAEVERVTKGWFPDAFSLRLEPWRESLAAEVRPALLALMGAVTLLLLIACANVANLLLVRTSLRERELAVRAALGARSGRLLRQMFAEAVVLAGIGTLLATGLCWACVRALPDLIPVELPRMETIAVDWRVLGFAALAGFVMASVFGLLPARSASRPDLAQVLRSGGRTSAGGAGRLLRHAVVVAEVALSFVLLAGSGLMLRSFLELRRVDPGFEPRGLLTFLLIGDARGFEQPARRLAFLREIQDGLRAIPGIESAGGGVSLPLAQTAFGRPLAWGTEQTQTDAASLPTANLRYVLPGYFETLRTRVATGRTFTDADNQPGRNLAVIDELLAAKAFPGQSAVGKRIFVKLQNPVWLEVIGVTAHQRLSSLAEPGADQIFVTDGFFGIGVSRHWALRTVGDASQYAAAVRAAAARIAPGRMAVTEMRTMEAAVDRAQAGTRFHLLLLGAFAAMAALLAGVGLYGVLSSAVRQRTAEIGVRMALGATPGGIFRLVVGQGVLLCGIGVALGLAAALGLTRAMTGMLVGVKATDPATFAAMTAVFFFIAAVACWAPARRAASLDAMEALREE